MLKIKRVKSKWKQYGLSPFGETPDELEIEKATGGADVYIDEDALEREKPSE